MKFRDLLLLEQPEPEEPFLNGNPEDNDELPGEQFPVGDEGDENDDQGEDPDQPQEPGQPKPQKQLSLTQQAKKKWLEENPALSDFQLDDAVGFFRLRKDNLREYHPYGYVDPQTRAHYINLPEVTALAMRFPRMEPVLSQNDKMKDIINYPWEVMEFYMDNVRAANAVIDEENLVPGTKLPFEEQLQLAKEKWNNPENKIIDEGGLKVYKIESKNESIIYGSIQRILNLKRKEEGNNIGNVYWCTTVPLNDKSRSNLWTNYRPEHAFYYAWDSTRDVSDRHYCTSIQSNQRGNYTLVDLYNKTITGVRWDEVVDKYPVLNGKERLFPHFGITPKEKNDLTIEKISMSPGNKYYFGTIPESYQNAYVDSGRHVNDVKAFLTMRPKTRKLYVDKTSLEDGDVQTRFTCNDPNNPYGILEILRLQIKPENLYKYLDNKILRTNLGIEEGILAIKKLIIGTNWDRWLSDDEKQVTLIRKRPTGQRNMRETKIPYGIMNAETGDIVKPPEYVAQLPKPYVKPYLNAEGRIMRDKQYIFQKFAYKSGDGNVDQNEGFYMFYSKTSIVKPQGGNVNESYLKAQYFELEEGEQYINSKVNTGELVKI